MTMENHSLRMQSSEAKHFLSFDCKQFLRKASTRVVRDAKQKHSLLIAINQLC